MPHKQISACFICLTICFFELYIIKNWLLATKNHSGLKTAANLLMLIVICKYF